ncbi:proliferation marker protein Ki-67 isoform X2 [Bos javanicus]|uniref:proliferation marker protein Ki-67 isoform X2 n=1 Tax=Bos javanicus TaxID=9906 RepID=UPI002AA69A53|nr:proliferation marker protein Ki-67 isoform X2 [Bos javanicus]
MGPTRRLVTIKRSGVDGPHFPLSLSTCLFGRSIECDIRIQLPVVSKQHCKIEISEQEAVLFNFSSTNPTQINGSTFDKPVQLKHGDVITIVDRSFRYENESHQDGSKSPGFPGQRRDQEASRRVSRSSLSSNPGKAQDSSAHSEVTEEAVSGRPVAHGEDVTATHAVSGRQEDHVSRKTPSRVRSSELPGDTCRDPTDPTTGDLKEDRSVASGTCREEPKALSSIQCLKRSDQSESPFRKLYESMKVELDVNPGKDNVLQNRRKSGLQHHCTAGRESADGLQDETLVSPKSRRKSGRSPHKKADPGLGEQGSSQTEGDGSGEPVQMPKEPKSPGIALTETETRKTRTPVRCSQQTTMPLWCSPHSPSRRQQSEDPSVGGGRASQSLDQSEGSRADDQMFTPQKFLPGNQTPVKIGSFENTPEKLFSRKRKSVPANVDRLTAETEIPPPMISAPLALQVERKIESDLLNKPEKLGPATGQVGPGLSGLDAADVSSFGDSTNKMEGMAAKRRRVSFGGCLRPELFDENLPPNTPLKRGETPKQRRSLAAHTPTVLKKIIKEQPQPSGKEDSSEVRLKVTSPDAFMSPLAANAVHASAATPDRCRRLSKVSCVSGVSRSPHQTDVPRKGGRRSGSLPPQRASLERNQHGILQTIFSRRRSGASEANLIVARSWADVVKLGAKQAQNKAVKRGLPKQPGRRQRRANTPKKPPGPVHSQFSTGHANSPCTIVIGKAQLEKVTAPARPYRVINNFLVSKPRDFSEDLSGLPEMFKTPVKEKPQRMSMCPPTFPNSEDLLGKELPGPHSGEKPLLCTLENFGEDVFPRTHDTAKGPSDQSSASPALRRPSIKMSEDPVKTPRSTNKTIAAEIKTPVSTTATPKATSSANRSRRSAELSGVQTPGTGPENQDAKPDTVEDILGRRLRKTPQPELKPERDTKESEKSFEQCKQNIKSKENSEKTIAVRRSRRASELKCEPAADLTTLQRSQDTEPEEKQVDILSLLQTPVHAKEVTDAKNKATRMSCKSPKPGAVSIHTRMSTQLKTPSQKVDVGSFSDLRKLSETPGKATPTQRESRDAKSIQLFKETSKQKLDPAENSAGSKRRPTTPKGKAPPLEDLAGFKELFQTPHQAKEPMTDDKTTKTPCTSPQSESVNTPSRRERLRTPSQKVNVQEDLSALRKPQQTPGKATRSPREPEGGDKGIAVSQEAPEEMLDLAEKVPSAKRRPRTPKGKAQPLEDLTGFKELFQTPDQAREPMTDAKTTKTPCKSSQPEPVNTPSRRGRLRTPSQKVDVEEELSSLGKPQQIPRETGHSDREPADGEDIKVSKEMPRQKMDPADYVTGIKRQSRTPKEDVQSLEDLTGFRELFQTPTHTNLPRAIVKTPQMLGQSPQLKPVNMTPTRRGRLRTPSQKMDVQEDLSALRKPQQTPGETTQSPREPEAGDRSIAVSQEAPEEMLDLAEKVPATKRRSRTPKRKTPLLEDLAGFKELFQTPHQAKDTMTDEKPTTIPCKSPPAEPVNTPTSKKRQLKSPPREVGIEEELSVLRRPAQAPGGTRHSEGEAAGDGEDIKAFMEMPRQKLDPGIKRQLRTPKEKVQSLEDLTGFRELFQTPNHTKEPKAVLKTPQMLCTSSQSELIVTPTNRKRQPRTLLGKVDTEKELSVLRRHTPASGQTMHTWCREPGVDDKSTESFEETPKQKLGPAENSAGSKRRPTTPKGKAPPLEDLAGFKELFQTPHQAKEPMTDDKTTKTPCTSPQSEPVNTPSRRGRLRTPSQKVNVQEDLSALRKPQQTPGKATRSPREPEGGDKGIAVSQEAPEEMLDLAEKVPSAKRRPRTPKGKAQPLEDLTGFKELFQTPDQAREPMTDAKTTKTPCTSPQPEPVNTPSRTPSQKVNVLEGLSALRKPQQTPGKTTQSPREPEGGDKGIAVSQKAPEEMLDLTEKVPSAKRRPRTPKRKAQPLEDLTGFKELFQTPDQAREPMTDAKTTKTLYKSPAETVNTPTSKKRRLKSPPREVGTEEELSVLRRPAQTPRGTRHSGEAGSDFEDIKAFTGTPRQKLDPGIKRQLRTPKEKVQSLEDLTGFRELFQTPDHTKEPRAVLKTPKMLCQSPLLEPVNITPGRRGSLRTPSQKVDMQEDRSALRKPTHTPGVTTHSPKEPEGGDRGAAVSREAPEEKPDPAEHSTASKRRPRTPQEKAQLLEDLDGFKELFQTPDRANGAMTDDKLTTMPCTSPPAEPFNTPTSEKRRLKSSPQKVGVKEELSALRRPAQTPRGTRHSEGEQAGDGEERAFKKTPKQKLDSAESLTGSKRRPRASLKEKAQPLEDLTGFKELFQTPRQSKEPMTDNSIPQMLCQSPQPEPVTITPGRRGHLRTPSKTVDRQEDCSALRKPQQTPGETTHSPREPEDGDRGTAVSQEAPEEKPDSAENVTAHKRWPRITKEKAQPLEDLSGFKELFQTPDHAKQPIMIDDHPSAIPCKSPAEPVTRRTGRKKQLRSSPEKVGVEEPSALRRPSQTPEEATRMQREAEEDEKDIKVCKKTSRQKLVSAENVTGVKSRLRNIKEKAQPTEDPARVKEPFQNPNQTEEPASDVKIAPASCQSPPVQPVIRRTTRQRRLRSPPGKVAMEEPSASTGPTQTPGDTHTEPVGKGKDSKVLKETSGQKLSPAENVTGIRSRLRTLKKKTQPLEDSASVKELFQKPDQAKEADGDVTIAPGPRPSPPAEPVTRPISRKRRPKSSPEKVDKEEPTPTPGESTRGQPARDEEDSRVLKEKPRQKLNPAENVTGVRSRLRTLREKTQPLEDPASVKELFQDPDQVKEPEGDVTTIPMPRQSPPAKPITRPTSRKRRLKASPEKVDIERPSALREPTRTPGETTHSEPVHDEKDNRVLKENSKQKLNPAENVTGVRSRLRTLREKTQPLEDPASVKELFQDPDQVKEPEGDVTTIPMPRQSPPAKPITRPTSRKRRLKASPEKVDIERPSALREPTRTPGETTHSEPVHDEKDNRVLKENSKQKLNPAENVIGVRSRLRTLKEKTQPLKDLAGAKELFQKQDGAKEPVSDVTTAPAPHQSPPAQPVTRRTGRQKQLRSPPRKVAVDKPSALSRPAQTPGEMTHTEPVGDENKIKMAKETSRRNLNSAENFIGVRSRQKAFQEKTVEDPAGSQEPFQKPDQAEELESSSTAIKRASKQTADRRPVETSRRVLRAPKVRFTEDLVGSREPAKHPGESCVSPSPEREQGEDGRVTGRKRLRPVTAAQDPEDERPLQKKQRTAPRETREPPEPPGVKKRSLRTLAQRTEPGGNLPNDDLKAKATDPQEVAQAPNKGVSLRSRRPAKTSVEEQRPEVLISEEKVKIKRSEKKSVQPSQEMKLQSPEDGAKKPASGGKVEQRRTRSRPGRQNQPPLPEAAEEKAREGRVDIPAKKQEEKEGTGHSDPKGSRSRKVSVRPQGNPSETASEQRATRSAKRCAHSLQKESDNVCVKKMRTRSRRDPEDI